ncbi:TPA: LOW QUALITY PROTEIN: hypothetical protein N0F65_009696, partial [Lagenidium giganteum]
GAHCLVVINGFRGLEGSLGATAPNGDMEARHGQSSHICGVLDCFVKLGTAKEPTSLETMDGVRTKVDQIGAVELRIMNEETNKLETWHLADPANLISWGVMRWKGYRMTLSLGQMAPEFKMKFQDVEGIPSMQFVRPRKEEATDARTHHKRLAHASDQVIEDMVKSSAVQDLMISTIDASSYDCLLCDLGKARSKTYQPKDKHTDRPLQRLCSNLCSVEVVTPRRLHAALAHRGQVQQIQMGVPADAQKRSYRVQAGEKATVVVATTGIPISTLQKIVQKLKAGESLSTDRRGPKPRLPADAEVTLAEWMRVMAENATLIGRQEAVDTANEHPDLTIRRDKVLSRCPNAVDTAIVHGFLFHLIKKLFEDELTGEQVFNLDETSFLNRMHSAKVIASKNTTKVYTTEATTNYHLTLVACGNASGYLPCPIWNFVDIGSAFQPISVQDALQACHANFTPDDH